jgi:pimeloyl-ACP methyl ester carboxylesterase
MKILIGILKVVVIVYVGILVLLYFMQERLIFFPQKLAGDYHYSFTDSFEEMQFHMDDGVSLNGLLFKADSSRGLIFYLHGNAGSLRNWGAIAEVYTDLHYDVLMLDYRGYGKSGGTISSEAQLHKDIYTVYDSLRKRYRENSIVILGYSIGTGPAAKLASESSAKLLILQAPYYNLGSMLSHYYPIVPSFILKYKLETNKHIRACKMPVVIFHGDADNVISYSSSVRLKELLKPGDTLITLKGQPHNGMSDNPDYVEALKWVLGRK